MSEKSQVAETATPETGVIEVSAKKDGFGDAITITYDFGKDINEICAKFGNDVVFSNARANFKITLQGVMRRLIAGGKSAEEIVTACTDWKPGVQMERTVDPLAVARKAMSGMDDDAKQVFIDSLLAQG